MTEKTNIDDIIGIIKTEEKTDSVELKKEYYKNQSKDKHYTYLNYSKDGYIGSFYENDKPLTNKEVWDILDGQEELIKRLKTIREEQTETILKQKRKIKDLTTQLQTEEESVCIKCKHHYLTKKDPLHDAISNGEIVPFSSPLIDIEPYYISKCKKGHVECSKEDIRYCEDFKLKGDE